MASEKKERLIQFKMGLVGANLERADMRGLDLRGVNLTNANLRGADLSRCNLDGATMIATDLSRANLYQATLRGADLSRADMTGAYCRGTDFTGATMWKTYLRYGQYKSAIFVDADMTAADFVHSMFLGARFDGAILEDVKNADMATYVWYVDPIGFNRISYNPQPGWIILNESVLGDISVQENASREKLEHVIKRGYVRGESNQ